MNQTWILSFSLEDYKIKVDRKLFNHLNFKSHISFDSHLLFVQVTFISATREENKLCVTSLSISFLFTLLSVTPGAPPP